MDLAGLTQDLERLRDEAVEAAAGAATSAELDERELEYLGKKGRLTIVLRGIGGLPAEDRPKVGAVANVVQTAMRQAFDEAGARLRSGELERRLRAESVDVTTPGRPIRRGTYHPIVSTVGRIAEIFGQFGFQVYEGPEVEDDLTNFQMLNIPRDHPSRDLWDTLYVDVDNHLLRTHTSPGQIRVMEAEKPPIRALLPGRCYRYEAIDASHASEFFQVEGLMVDEGTTLADLKGLLEQFAQAMYGEGKRTRFRPGYYPFTEPSVAFDVECLVCGGERCPACSRTGWMTILGAGMVHPVVLQYGGIDPERYQGFAFGMGVERIANLRHGVGDLRLYMENDLRFLEAFRWRVPISWLRDYVDVELTPERLAERLTLLGMEVQGIERWGADWQNVVVGELLEVGPHPRADRLSLTRVRVGDGEPLEIVCGATNISVGQRVPVALPGAVLPGGRPIERTEKMGVTSNGMLCSGDELRLTTDADGILILSPDAPIGAALTDLYGDVILDVDVKPNRGDALSLVGLAREVAAATGAPPPRWPETDPPESGAPIDGRLSVDVQAPELCTRFVARWVSGVAVGPSPDRVQMRLLAAGMRPISNVVDASNYVMLELGKPIHAFDAAAIARDPDGRARIVVRRATPGERLETLDHVQRTLDEDTLLIADPTRPLAMAGILGGASSEVGEATTDVVVESAIFDPVSIRRTGQRYALRSEASLRFEKGQEVRLARIGADRTARLIRDWAGGEVAPGRIDTNPVEPERRTVTFRPGRVNRLLGTDLAERVQRDLLARVGIESEAAAPGDEITVALEPQPIVVQPAAGESAITAVVPTWRRDIAIEADVTEEVARVHGYDRVPAILPHTPMPHWRPSPLEVRDAVREALVGAGLTEVVTFALVSPRLREEFLLRRPVESVEDGEPQPAGEPLVVTNPLSRDHSVLRSGLTGSLVEVVGTNLRHGRPDIAIFEVGKGYAKLGDRTREWWRLGFALTGPAEAPAWNRPARAFEIDDAKAVLELIARRLGLDAPAYRPETDEPVLHPGRTLRATAARHSGGRPGLEAVVGELHPNVLDRWELRAGRVIVAEVAIAGLGAGSLTAVRSVPPPRHPTVERDLAVVVEDGMPAARVAETLRGSGGELLRWVELFDIYRGSPLEPTQKSLAHRLTFAADRTLTEAEVDEAVERIATTLERDLGARRRS